MDSPPALQAFLSAGALVGGSQLVAGAIFGLRRVWLRGSIDLKISLVDAGVCIYHVQITHHTHSCRPCKYCVCVCIYFYASLLNWFYDSIPERREGVI